MSTGIPDCSVCICTVCDVHGASGYCLFYDFTCADCMHNSYPDSENPNEMGGETM